MLIRQKTANAAKTSLFGAGVFSDARFDATSLRDYEISTKWTLVFSLTEMSIWQVAYGTVNLNISLFSLFY